MDPNSPSWLSYRRGLPCASRGRFAECVCNSLANSCLSLGSSRSQNPWRRAIRAFAQCFFGSTPWERHLEQAQRFLPVARRSPSPLDRARSFLSFCSSDLARRKLCKRAHVPYANCRSDTGTVPECTFFYLCRNFNHLLMATRVACAKQPTAISFAIFVLSARHSIDGALV